MNRVRSARRGRKFGLALSCAGTLLAGTRPGQATPIDWTNPAGGTFQVGANWSGGVPPGTSDDARFALVGTPVQVTLTAAVNNQRLTVASGADVTVRASPFNYVLSGAAGAGGAAGVTVGDVASADAARLDLTDGNIGAFDVVVGDAAGARGAVIVRAASLGASRQCTVGNAGSGTLTSGAGGFLNLGTLSIGNLSGAKGNVTLNGGFFGVNGALFVGRAGAGTLEVNADTDIGTGAVTVGDAAGSTGLLNLRSNVEWGITGALNVANAGDGTFLLGTGTMTASQGASVARQSGSHGLLNINGGSITIFGAFNVGGGSLSTGGDGTLSIDAGSISILGALRVWDHGRVDWNGGKVTTNSIDLRGGGTMNVAANAGVAANRKLLRTSSISIDTARGSRLDVSDNAAIFTASTKAQIESYVATARAGGNWAGPGITSSVASSQAAHATGIGVLSGAEFRDSNAGANSFAGVAVNVNDVLVKYTWNGDANLSGAVNFDDYVRIDTGFNQSLTGWANGDFNYDGAVTFDDYVLIDVAFNQQNGTLARAIDWVSGDDRSGSGLTETGVQEAIEHVAQFGGAYASAFLAAVPEPGFTCLVTVVLPPALFRRGRRVRDRASIRAARTYNPETDVVHRPRPPLPLFDVR